MTLRSSVSTNSEWAISRYIDGKCGTPTVGTLPMNMAGGISM